MKLYVVPTPIGNLKDITLRALDVLNDVDIILAEDTRTSKVLLNHYQINKPLWSYHQHNEHFILVKIINEILIGKKIALISDAGTPAISDPGFLLVRACIKQNISVECLPGATAFVPALVLSGFPVQRFLYEGFLPLKKGRQTIFKRWNEEDNTIVFYESPHRLLKTLNELKIYLHEQRRIAVCRELSKKFEEVIRGTIDELITHFQTHPPKGEFVVVLSSFEKKQ
ncbi:MAG TPA: 16S rRNA (cytidine(1402)-2'-O)-methyltransferase [Chitinophagaceae bacterium]|nr:16S rRNA (cytidine(1402)-2'-O)-methyltransferase [Chitinophagaceae bacterium]